MQAKWEEWNRLGLIPGPSESEEEFLRRVDYCLHLKEQLVGLLGKDLPFSAEELDVKSSFESFECTQQLYGIAPTWVPVFYSNHQLAPWHGGCAWIFQESDKTPMAAFLQLRRYYKNHSTYLGIYQRDELVAHECAHVGRMQFEEPQFEELLAYQSAKRSWRRWLGPLVRSSRESLSFVIAIGAYLAILIAMLSVQQPALELIYYFGLLGWMVIFVLAFGRLTVSQRYYQRCVQQLSGLLPQSTHLAYRLTDEEIRLFAKSSHSDIQAYIQSQKSFRWQFLKAVYPCTMR